MMRADDLEYHELLAHQNMEQIELAAVKAMNQQLEIPVVLVLDIADPAAKEIAFTSGRESQLEARAAEFARRGLQTVAVWSLPAKLAHRLLQATCPGVLMFEPLAGRNEFYIVAVSRGEMSLTVSQLP